MDDDDVSIVDSLDEATEQTTLEKQLASLQTYIDSVPYDCESYEEMQVKLEEIVAQIYICAKTKNWYVQGHWDSKLLSWLMMQYPMPTTTRVKLARFYYELCILPGIDPRVVRSWAEVLVRLFGVKPGMRRRVERSDLTLSWQPLWRVLQKELWPKTRTLDLGREVVNVLLFVAETSKLYYPAEEIPPMLNAFLPLLTKETIATMAPVLTSFLPPFEAHLYVPMLFKVWEAFNSGVVDDRFLDLAGEVSEAAHVAPEDNWKDVGVWTQAQWNILVGKGLGSMNVPVGANRGSSTTANHADTMVSRLPNRIRKSVSRQNALALIFVYSMAVDGPARALNPTIPSRSSGRQVPENVGYLAGSRALDTLDRFITSTESFFHPSNSGAWTIYLTTFLHRITSEFLRRLREEELESCQTPSDRRLTPAIRRAFVAILRTPALLAMFSKDSTAMSYAQGALRNLTMLEPAMMMPELLDRAYGGLEVVNETHRTTAVLNMLSGMARPLVTENIWVGGQKHLVPLLELCIPGIDLNDPMKTVCATLFIVSAIQHVKIGDLSIHQSGLPLSDDILATEQMDDATDDHYPEGTEIGAIPVLTQGEERTLVRESTAGFADWVASLFRRIFSLYENLPEEGGRKHTTGGKAEESMLKSIKSMMDIVCLHLSDQLFNLALNLVYEYATTNARSNSVRAFGQLVACLARVRPEQTMAKFLPFCLMQIEEELKHGASSVRTTSSHSAIPSDTTLHWNLAILRGCLGYGGPALLKYKTQLINLLRLLVDKTKGERGFSGTGFLISRILHTLAGVYPLNSRFVNTEEWSDPKFNQDHNVSWGRLYEPRDVKIEWHTPSDDEITFVLDILDQVIKPALDKLDTLLATTARWDGADRNDFCRYLYACRSAWVGLPTFLLEQPKEVVNPCLNADYETEELLVSHLDVKAGFTLTDPRDPRYQKAASIRTHFGQTVCRAASVLRQDNEDEDHTDAVVAVCRAIDVYLLEYALDKPGFNSLQKGYAQAKNLNQLWARQKDNSRLVLVKRAQIYHSGRVYMHALYRRRSALDDKILLELAELCLSPYTRIRRQAQAVLQNACSYYVRSTRLVLPVFFNALIKGNEPDRMKGALYMLWSKGIAAYALNDLGFHCQYLLSLLECQHEEKPSVQKLVSKLSHGCLEHFNDETLHTDGYTMPAPRVDDALADLVLEFSPNFVNTLLLREASSKSPVRIAKRTVTYNNTVQSILSVATRRTTHWRYIETAISFLCGLLRRDVPPSPEIAKFIADHTTSAQPTIRTLAQMTIVKATSFIKMRTYAKNEEELWLDEWMNPLAEYIAISDPQQFLTRLFTTDESAKGPYFDKIRTGFVSWTPTIKAYHAVPTESSTITWEGESQAFLDAIKGVLISEGFLEKLASLWSQESSKNNREIQFRTDNAFFIKSLAKMFGKDGLENLLSVIDPLLADSDKFKQQAGAEMLSGLLRGSKHWPSEHLQALWQWTVSRMSRFFAQIKPDTLPLWEQFLTTILNLRDPRRNQPLVDWIMALPLDFNKESAFDMTKTLSTLGILIETLGISFNPHADRYAKLIFDNANTSYAETRVLLCQCIYSITKSRWQPFYPSTEAFLRACESTVDPLKIREPPYRDLVNSILEKLPAYRDQRLPPPRVSQSEYDKIGLTLLQWIWVSAYGPQACLMFPYVIPMLPEILRMSELNDSSELQTYSSAVLYILAAVTPPIEYVEAILDILVEAIKSSLSWRVRLHALPALIVFFYRNLLLITAEGVTKVTDVLLECLGDENVEVREMASKVLSGVIRCSQRQSIIPLKNRFVAMARKFPLPERRDPTYANALRSLHSAILGICALIESLPYSVEEWMPPLTEVLARHATDPPPISTTIRKCASEFKKTHQDTWHKDQQMFNEDQLQSLSTMLVGTSYYA